MEKIIIKNFGGLKDAEIILNKVNVFIGKQASGKSVTAKLIYFFKSIIVDIFEEFIEIYDGFKINLSEGQLKTNKVRSKVFLDKFESYFPFNTWSNKPFEIIYYVNENEYIKIEKKRSKLAIEWPKVIENLFLKLEQIYKGLTKSRLDNIKRFRFDKEDFDNIIRFDEFDWAINFGSFSNSYFSCYKAQIGVFYTAQPLFIPAGRSIFSILENNIFAILSRGEDVSIDPFLLKFGSVYQRIKDRIQNARLQGNLIDNISEEILGSKYYSENKKDYLIHNDNRKVDLSFASSGQQETLPLLLILKYFVKQKRNSSVFIEEPEAHLFPAAQKKITELISLVFNRNGEDNLQFTITTHSPYILSSFNNLVQASILYNSASTKNKKKINQIIPKELHLNPDCLSAYAFRDGRADSIIDTETQLIYAEYLDSVSEDIGSEFSDLLDVE